MTFDFDRQTAQLFANYLAGAIDPSIAIPPPTALPEPDETQEQPQTTDCLIVTFFDPMSIQEANRIVVIADSGHTQIELTGNATISMEVWVKSRWAQETIKADFDAHWDRLCEVRKWIWDSNLLSNMANVQTAANSSVSIDYVQPGRDFSHTTTTDGWLADSTKFNIEVHTA